MSQVIERVKKFELSHFKGYSRDKGPYIFDTDADIVLLMGPNGFGKTSFLEALTLVLTGFCGSGGPRTLEEFLELFRPVTLKESDKLTRIYLETRTRDRVDPTGKSDRVFGLAWDGEGRLHHTTGSEHDSFPGTAPSAYIFDEKMHVAAPSGPDGPFPMFLPFHPWEKPASRAELHARLCAFFQERIRFQFDQLATGDTVRDVLEPVQPEIQALIDQLNSVVEALKAEIEAYESPSQEEGEALKGEFRDGVIQFMDPYNRYSALNNRWPRIPERFESGHNAMDFFNQVLQDLGRGNLKDIGDITRTLNRELQQGEHGIRQWLAAARKRDTEKTEKGKQLQEKLDQLRKRQKAVSVRFPRLEKELGLFAPESGQGADALTVFETLAENGRRWGSCLLSDPLEQKNHRLQDIRKAFDRVDVHAAMQCRDVLAEWLKPRQKAKNEIDFLEEQIQKIEKKRDQEIISREIKEGENIRDAFKQVLPAFCDIWKKAVDHEEKRQSQAQRKKAADSLRPEMEAASGLLRLLEEDTDISEELEEQLSEMIRKVSSRFRFTPKFLPLKLEFLPIEEKQKQKQISLQTPSGLGLNHFSTGQKAQVGVSLLVSQNLLLSRYLVHQVILLDDVTTAYDLSNLTRESLLWRQLAYGSRDNPEGARQLFISTHHEDLTNKLVELLAPPHGGSLHLIHFKDWHPDTGPVYDTYSVVPSAEGKQERISQLARDLKKTVNF